MVESISGELMPILIKYIRTSGITMIHGTLIIMLRKNSGKAIASELFEVTRSTASRAN